MPRFEVLEERSLLSATPLGSEYLLNTTVVDDQRDVAIGTNPKSTQLVMAWTSANEDGAGDGVYAQRFDVYGGRIGAAFRVNTPTTGDQGAPAIAMDALGNFVIAWESSAGDGWDIYARRYAYDGTPLAAEFRANSTTPNTQRAPSIAMDDAGEFAIAWQADGRDNNGNAVVFRSYNVAGTATGGDVRANSTIPGNQQSPSIAMAATSGNIVIAWQSANQDASGNAIVARRFSKTMSTLSSEFIVNQTTLGDQSAPAVAANDDGSFVIAWQSAGQDGDSDAIVARRYNSAGTAAANEFLVNQFSAGSQAAPEVASTSSGGFVVTWLSAGQNGDNSAIVARQYSTAGTATGNEFVVNTVATTAANRVAVAMQLDGDFLIGWQSPGHETGGGASLGVFARRYDVTNDAPVMRQIFNQITDVGGTIAFVAQASDQDAPVDPLTYTLLAGAPAGATINAATGAFTWDTTGVAPGRYFATIEVHDAAGLRDDKQVAITVFAPGERTVLDDYVNNVGSDYKWDLRSRVVGDGFVKYNLLMTSGMWRTAAEVDKPLWQHWMSVYVPNTITQSKAILYVDLGNNSANPPTTDAYLDPYAGPLAAAYGTVIIDLFTIPNQPLKFAGESSTRIEDQIIAYSWAKYLATSDPTWIANLPMTRATLRAMDAASDFLGSPLGGNFDIASFVVAGGSKRGWTTWLAAATDPRVSDEVPIISDLLNTQENFVHHYAFYNGTFASAVQDYVAAGVLNVNLFGTDKVNTLLSVIDPYSYRARLTLPKYLVNVSNDEFFVPDSWSFYYDDLPGPKAIRYMPNSSHIISDPQYLLDSFAMMLELVQDAPPPEYSFHQLADGTIEMSTGATVVDAKLWQATNPTSRDFRWPTIGAAYTSSQLEDQGGGVYRANVPQPSPGFTAYFIELTIETVTGAWIKVTSGIYIKGSPPVNRQPTLSPLADVTLIEGSPLLVNVSASDPDAGQTLTYSLSAPVAGVTINPTTGVITGQWNDQVASQLVVVTVKDNGAGLLPNRDTFLLTVINAAPSAGVTGLTAGSPGQSYSFTLSATDPSSVDQAAGFTFDIDWNGDGAFDETVTGLTGKVVSHTFANGTSANVRVRATDKDGGASTPATHTISLNQAPIDPHNQQPLTIAEGSSLVLSATGWTDPNNDLLTYTWDINGDNVFSDATGSAPTLTWSQLVALGIDDGPALLNVTLRVSDGLGGVTDAATTLTIINVAPQAAVIGPTLAPRGTVQTFTFSAADISDVDMGELFTYQINWGDGSPIQLATGGSSLRVTHAFNPLGALTISVTAADADGDFGVASTHGVQIVATQLLPNAQNSMLTDLVWYGTTGDDQVDIEQVSDTTIRVRELTLAGVAVSNTQEFTDITGRAIAYGHVGNDLLRASGLTTTQATLDGGAGNNKLYGGAAGDILIGGYDGGEGRQGNNVIIAGNGTNTIYGNGIEGAEGSTGGNNLIVGGTGSDTIYGAFGSTKKKSGNAPTGGEGGQNLIIGGGGGDVIYASQSSDGGEGGHGSILVAGSTNLGESALLAILNEWTSARSLGDRVANIQGTGSGPSNNVGAYLQFGVTVFDDDVEDRLASDSSGAADWLIYNFNQDTAERVKVTDAETEMA